MLNFSFDTIDSIFHEKLNKKNPCTKFVSHFFMTEQKKKQRVMTSQKLVDFIENNPNFLQKVVLENNSWCFKYNPSIKCQSSEWTSLCKS